MARIDKTVFISYRRADWSAATLVFQNLSQHGFDVFIDFDGLASGDFEHAILENIRARAHFVVLLTPTALDRCDEPGDWLRREMEAAMAAQRNVVPLLLNGFTFESDSARRHLQGALAPLRRYNALSVPHGYFDDAMGRLRSKYLAVATDAVLHPPSEHAQRVAEQQQAAAQQALEAPATQASPSKPPPKVRKPRLRKSTASDDTASHEPEPANDQRLQWVIGAVMAVVVVGGGWLWQSLLKQAPQGLAAVTQAMPARGVAVSGASWPSRPLPRASNPGAASQNSDGHQPLVGALLGDAADQVTLGLQYLKGQGVKQDDVQAVYWFTKAADQNDGRGLYQLARMYQAGRGGLPKDLAKANLLYRQAADLGNSEARFTITIGASP